MGSLARRPSSVSIHRSNLRWCAQKSLRFPDDWSLLGANCAALWSRVLRLVRPASSRGSKMRFWNVLFLGLSFGFLFGNSALAQPKSPAAAAPATSSAPESGRQTSPLAVGATDASAASKSDADGKNKSGAAAKGDTAARLRLQRRRAWQLQCQVDRCLATRQPVLWMVQLIWFGCETSSNALMNLKEQIRRSHTRLSLLSDTILAGGVGGARAEITFINDMSNVFQLTRALFLLDGAVQNNKQDETGVLADQKEIPVFSGSIPPGDRTLQVLVQLRGHGFGVFSYLQGYRFEIRSSHSFYCH